MDNLYLYINLLTLSAPLLLSFDKKVAFFKQWKYLFPAIFIMGVFFIAKDVIFAATEIWGFNDRYLIGFRMLGLPIEEWMFFLVVPYAIVFIYACLVVYVKKDVLAKIHRPFFVILSIVLIGVGLFYYDRLYTSVVFIITALLLLYNVYKKQPWLSYFLLAYLVSLIPFLIVNGALTGYFTEEPIVWYDNSHNLGIRILTIPIEDTVYSLLMMLMTVQLMEWLKEKY
ncbi:MAG: lycopene cyclase domain-containing protein [Bacteroidetes bacterium]|nr:lycopene cyclase domain-containing protein [Bacteroidota bacterium]MBU2557489.1 lycopene cyclase domain-containing protein [Bacteroidota bacterium]